MANDKTEELLPAKAFSTALKRVVVNSLYKHPMLRKLIGIIGTLIFLIGALFVPTWGTPIVYWLHGEQISGPLLVSGLGMLHLWQLSDKKRKYLSIYNISSQTDTLIRFLIGLIGILLLLVGSVCFMLKYAPFVSWAKPTIAPSFTGGLTALGIWYLSGKNYFRKKPVPAELPDQLVRLSELHETGSLTDDEFNRAKHILLEIDELDTNPTSGSTGRS